MLDITSPDISLLDLSVVVGDPAAPLCRASLWSQPSISGSGLQGSFGAGECASYWPPRDDRPWLLYGSSGTRKPATLNGWAVRTEDSVCTTPGAVTLPRQPGTISTNTCAGTDLVSNDTIEGARVVDSAGLPATFETDLRHATSTGDPSPTCANESSRGLWYRFESPDDVGVAVDTFGSAFNTVLAVYRDDGATLDQIACNNDFGSSQSRVVWSAERGQAYYVLATAYQVVPAGRLRVHFSVADIPANDSREGALPTSPADPQPVVHQAHSATSSPSDPAFSCVPFYGYSLWYRVPAATGGLTARTSGSNYDTVVAVYREGEDGALTEIACNDQEGPGIKTSVASWTGDGGDYLVVVAAYPGFVGGVLQLTVTQD
jgi:hypothetical protein